MTKRVRTTALITMASIVVIGGAILGYKLTYSNSILHNAAYGFQFMEPLELPPGFQITASRIEIQNDTDKMNGVSGLSADMNLRTEDWVYAIRESKYANQNIHTALNNYSTTSVRPTCIQESSADKRPYRLCHWIDYGRISVYQVLFVQNGVFINTTLPATLHQAVPLLAINAYVDSFVPASPPRTVVSGF